MTLLKVIQELGMKIAEAGGRSAEVHLDSATYVRALTETYSLRSFDTGGALGALSVHTPCGPIDIVLKSAKGGAGDRCIHSIPADYCNFCSRGL